MSEMKIIWEKFEIEKYEKSLNDIEKSEKIKRENDFVKMKWEVMKI
jgi:hypothetical protein